MLKNVLEKDPYLVKDAGGGYPPVKNNGGFAFSKQREYDSLYDQYKNRPDFSYDINEDALYQQYKDSYIQQGRLAMQDTMGQAAALTGGYGNSYAQSVGQQAYRAHLSELNDITPQLYQMALDRYNAKGEDMLTELGLLGDEREFEYGLWKDDYNRALAAQLSPDDEETNMLWYATGTYDDQGNPIFRNSDGQTQAFGAGINPYTSTKHSDAKYGTFSNGYQPDNIGGTKLKKAKKDGVVLTTNVTGKNQIVWEANGRYWLWRGDLNQYIEVDISDI